MPFMGHTTRTVTYITGEIARKRGDRSKGRQLFYAYGSCHSRSAHPSGSAPDNNQVVSSHWYLNRRVKLDLACGTEYLPRAPRSESYIPPVQLRLIDAAAKLGLSVTLS